MKLSFAPFQKLEGKLYDISDIKPDLSSVSKSMDDQIHQIQSGNQETSEKLKLLENK